MEIFVNNYWYTDSFEKEEEAQKLASWKDGTCFTWQMITCFQGNYQSGSKKLIFQTKDRGYAKCLRFTALSENSYFPRENISRQTYKGIIMK